MPPISLILLICLLLLPAAFLIQLLYFRMEFERALRWACSRPGMLLASAMPLWALFCFLLGICGQPILAGAGALLFALLTGCANYLMQTLRSSPIVPLDMIMALNMGKVLQMLSFAARVGIGAGAAAAASGIAMLLRLEPPLGLAPLSRLFLAAAGLLVFAGFFFVGKDRNPLRKLLLLLGADLDSYLKNGDALASYDDNGYLPAFFSNCGRPLMERPDGYSHEHIRGICSLYSPPPVLNSTTEKPHILFVMSESFSDPARIPGAEISRDPIPFIRSVMERFPSGHILAPGYGGSTAHCEFEALTGFSTGLVGGNSSFECNVGKRSCFPAFPHRLLDLGYRTTALHPYQKGMYSRETAYPAMGIEQFLSAAEMTHTGKVDNNPYISDREAYDEALSLLRSADRPQFIHLVTMQNHGGYTQKGRFHNTITARGVKQSHLPGLETYLQGIHYTDEATRYLLQQLDALDHPALVVFWGDHLPGVYPPALLKGSPPEKYETPFFLWANYPLENKDFGTVSAMHLPVLAAKAAKIPPTGLDSLLETLLEQLPGVNSRFSLDKNRNVLLPGRLAAQPPEALGHLRLLQYDAMLGEGYAEQQGFFQN